MHAGDYALTETKLNYVMRRCKDIDFIEEVLPALRVWAEMERRRGDFDSARRYLRQTWNLAKRGPFPLYNSDSYNTLARIELSEGNNTAAIAAANTAYRLAWCDGPPYSYQRGIDEALKVLTSLDQMPVDLPVYDNNIYSPVPTVALNPQDEFFN